MQNAPHISSQNELFASDFYQKCTGSYSFSFNGKEKDDEWDGVTGSKLDFGARIYDSRIGRWLSVDPLQTKYPSLGPYNFTNNNPILLYDFGGKDFEVYIKKNRKDGSKTAIIKATIYTISKHTKKQAEAGVAEWEKLNGQTVDFNGENVKVEFQIDVEVVENVYDEDLAVSKAQEDDKANAFLGTTNGDYIKSNENQTQEDEVIAGLTTNGEIIGMTRNYKGGDVSNIKVYADDSKAVAHELGHIFGLEDNGGNGGAMDYDTYKKGPNMKDVQSIINYALSPKEEGPKTRVYADEDD